MAQDFQNWLDQQLSGDYSDASLKALHERAKTALAQEKSPKKKQDLTILEQALAGAVKDRLLYTGTPLDEIDLNSLI